MDMIYKVTVERCIACGKCELACAFAHGSEGKPSKTRINIFRRGPELGTPVVCFQCADAACAAICPTEALVRNPVDRRHRHGARALHLVPDVRGRLPVRQHAVGRGLPLRAEVRPVRRRPQVRAVLPDPRPRVRAGGAGGRPARAAPAGGCPMRQPTAHSRQLTAQGADLQCAAVWVGGGAVGGWLLAVGCQLNQEVPE